MATNLQARREELEVRDLQGMFRQAAISFKASLSLFLTLALLLTLFKAAVLSGLRSDIFQITLNSSLIGASNSQPNTGGLKEPDTEISMQSHVLTLLWPSNDHASHTQHVKQENSSRLEPISSNTEDSNGSNGAPPLSKRDVGALVAMEGFYSAEETHGQLFLDTDEPKRVEAGVVQEDGDVSKEETHKSEKQIHGSSVSNRVGNFEAKGVFAASDSLPKANYEIGDAGHIGGDIQRQHNDRGVLEASVDSVDEQLDMGDADEQSLFEDMFDMNEYVDASSGLPHIQITIVSNKTGKSAQPHIEDTYGLTYFTGGLWGQQRVDQDAMDYGGLAFLLFGLLIFAVSTFFFVFIKSQHAMVLGVVAYSVASTHMGKRVSTRRAALSGLKSGIGHLIWLSYLHATLRSLQTWILRETLFGGMLETEQVKQLSTRLSTPPFAILAPLRDEIATDFMMASRIGLFIGSDLVCSSMANCIYVVACWILIMERNGKFFGAIKRSCYLIKGMILQALVIQLLKAVMCGSTSRWLLQQAIGQLATDFIISAANLYFLVLWFIIYLSARSVNDQAQFSYRNLEDFLDQFK